MRFSCGPGVGDSVPGKVGEAGGQSATSCGDLRQHGLASLVVLLRRQALDQRMILLDHTELRGAPRGTEVGEEVNVGGVVLLPLLRSVIFVEDRLHWAHR